MRRKEPKWLLRKVSGSRGRFAFKPDYSATRHKKQLNLEELPQREGMGRGHSYLDTTLVKRWLYKQEGRNFDAVYSDFLKRVQPKYLDAYKDCIFEYVDKPEDTKAEGVIKFSSNKPFYIQRISKILKKYSDSEIKSRSSKIITNSIGRFYFQHKEQIWETIGVSPIIKFKGDIANLTLQRIEAIKNYLDKIERLKLKAIDEINEFAEANKIEMIVNGLKTLLAIELLQSKKEVKINLYFDVAGNRKKDWKVAFTGFTIETIEIINNVV